MTLILIQYFVKADVFASFIEALIGAIKGNMTGMIRLLVYINLYLHMCSKMFNVHLVTVASFRHH